MPYLKTKNHRYFSLKKAPAVIKIPGAFGLAVLKPFKYRLNSAVRHYFVKP
jgi:hypothetical protein